MELFCEIENSHFFSLRTKLISVSVLVPRLFIIREIYYIKYKRYNFKSAKKMVRNYVRIFSEV